MAFNLNIGSPERIPSSREESEAISGDSLTIVLQLPDGS